MENLRELMVEELKDLYSAEKQIVKALPKIVRGAASEALKGAITEHLEITKVQVTRLEEASVTSKRSRKRKHCKGMEGLLQEGAGSLEEEDKGILRDLQLIGAAQRVEHYEVAAYGTAKAIAGDNSDSLRSLISLPKHSVKKRKPIKSSQKWQRNFTAKKKQETKKRARKRKKPRQCSADPPEESAADSARIFSAIFTLSLSPSIVEAPAASVRRLAPARIVLTKAGCSVSVVPAKCWC